MAFKSRTEARDYQRWWNKSNRERCRNYRRKYRAAGKEHALEIQKLYGLTALDYARLLEGQGGVCAICGRAPRKRLAVDHDHATERNRGLLCHACNTGLGMLDGVLHKALEYVREYVRVSQKAG